MSASSPVEILIVEDNPYDLEMTLRGFTAARMLNHIHVARDGEEALEFLFRRGAHAERPAGPLPRLILLDLKLPKVDGLEVLAAIRGHESTRTLPVVMMTSSQEQNDLVRSYEMGVNSYIVKPVQFEGFIRAVQEIGMYWMLLNQPPTAAG